MSTEIKFYKLAEPGGFLSNFYASPIDWDGKIWLTTEHLFQALKFTDEEHREQVRTQTTPRKAAELGRQRHWSYRQDWDAVKDYAMFVVNLEKFKQNPDLREKLLATGDSRLIEHTKKDAYWGDGGDGSGLNRLGVALMRVRGFFGGVGVV